MSLFLLTAEGDLDRGPDNKGFSRVGGVQEAKMHLETRTRLARGEVKRDTRIGVDHLLVFDPATPNGVIANHIASIQSGTPGIVDVKLNFVFEPISGVFETFTQCTFDANDLTERRQIESRVNVSPIGLTT